MNSPYTLALPPGPEALDGIGATSWIDHRAGGLACLLLTSENSTSESALRGMALGLGLAGIVVRPVPVAAHGRVLMRGKMADLDYGHDSCLLQVPTSDPLWLARASTLGAVRVTVGLDPLTPGADREAVGAYLRRAREKGHAFSGVCVAAPGG
ncbi:hypothetical protein I3F58_05880 [Streptomyces sp. MUM 203J]|uniref:hypothetical protein n=1 Tax=Streptomyces sp. MUM 203J TaxID=2791990 RepID=UPI001F04C9D8|nr:hypothetical protein [Streptomyces sp. MUM 203J]MCH0539092.1 hypothetical protein [Streptomyces sp. MUM 203J]